MHEFMPNYSLNQGCTNPVFPSSTDIWTQSVKLLSFICQCEDKTQCVMSKPTSLLSLTSLY